MNPEKNSGADPTPPPEPPHGPGRESWAKRAWKWLVNPTARLSPDFPLTGKKLGKTYVIASIIFYVGTFLPALVFAVALFLLMNFASEDVAYNWLTWLFDVDTGSFNTTPLAVFLLVSFVSGFLPQLLYLAKVLRRDGHSLWNVMGMSVSSLRGPTRLRTAWNLFRPALMAYGLMWVLDHVLSMFLHGTEQPTVQMLRNASGGNIAIWFVMAAILAPLFEELTFRGFLFQALRAQFYEWQKAEPAVFEATAAPSGWLMRIVFTFFLPVIRLWDWFSYQFKRFGRWLGRKVINTSGRADWLAVLLSGALFAVEHMQFQPLTLLGLFLMGVVLAELFRRTGSLWPSILLHAMNNGMIVIAIALGWA